MHLLISLFRLLRLERLPLPTTQLTHILARFRRRRRLSILSGLRRSVNLFLRRSRRCLRTCFSCMIWVCGCICIVGVAVVVRVFVGVGRQVAWLCGLCFCFCNGCFFSLAGFGFALFAGEGLLCCFARSQAVVGAAVFFFRGGFGLLFVWLLLGKSAG